MINRRGFLTGLIAAPAIVRIDSIMPVKLFAPTWPYGRSPAISIIDMLAQTNELLYDIINPAYVVDLKTGKFRPVDTSLKIKRVQMLTKGLQYVRPVFNRA